MSIITRVFVDFWNFQLSVNDYNQNFRVDWEKLSPFLLRESSILVDHELDNMGTKIYYSYNVRSEGDRHLRHFAENTLARFTGIEVYGKERKPKGHPKCQDCHNEITVCPHCGANLERTIEKGVDTAIVTDILSLAWEKSLDLAILLSSDRDFIPAVEYLARKGIRTINPYWPPTGSHLANICWASIDLSKKVNEFQR